jgi:hypothetical protein
MSDPPIGWQNEWLFLRNDTDVPLPVFMGNHLVLQPNWWYGVAQWYICKLPPLLDVVR